LDTKLECISSLALFSLSLHLIQNFYPSNCPSEVSSSAMYGRDIKLASEESKAVKAHLMCSLTHSSVCLVFSFFVTKCVQFYL